MSKRPFNKKEIEEKAQVMYNVVCRLCDVSPIKQKEMRDACVYYVKEELIKMTIIKQPKKSELIEN